MAQRACSHEWKYQVATQAGLVTTTEHCPHAPCVSLRFDVDPDQQGKAKDHVDRLGIHPELCHNIHASLEFKEHVTIWDLEDGDPSILDWLSALHPGDTIQIVPRAKYPLWVNWVREAKIEMWVEIADSSYAGHNKGLAELIQENRPTYERYRPLNNGEKEIRVVDLHPAKSTDAPLQLVLRLARLWYYLERKLLLALPRHKLLFLKAMAVKLLGVHSSRYDALSYCWGSHSSQDPPSLELSIEGMGERRTIAFAITPNLHAALRQLRLEHRTRTLWIDYICINQIDIEEHGQQVALMGEIFESAGSVCIWLGDSSPQIEEDWTQVPLSLNKDSLLTAYSISHGSVASGFFKKRGELVESVYSAGQMKWIGTMSCKPTSACENTGSMSGIRQTTRCLGYGMLVCHFKRSLGSRTQMRAPTESPRYPHPADSRSRHESHWQVQPNYGKNTIIVFADFTRWAISRHQSLRILSAIHTLNGRSWISLEKSYVGETSFDISQRPSWSFWYEGRSEFVFGTLAAHRSCNSKASGSDHPVDINLMDEVATTYPLCLALRGWEIDVISALAPYPFFQHKLSHSMDMQRAFIRIFDPVGRFGAWNDSGRSRTDIGDDATPMSELEFDEQMREFSHHYLAHWGSTPAAGKPDWIPCAGNCMFTTTQGLVGLCPAGVQAGDLVVILHGGDVPYIIRRNVSSRDCDESLEINERRSFVGECYLDGMMNGEACNLKQPEQDMIFHLF
ncbi:hypothetical protein LA080_016037 [Diaporthe eres]|nr:hypothetical protein LA080_016037 [Diaporthe eres]